MSEEEFNDALVAVLPRLRRYAEFWQSEYQDIDDIVQQTCLQALLHRDQWSSHCNFVWYLARLARQPRQSAGGASVFGESRQREP